MKLKTISTIITEAKIDDAVRLYQQHVVGGGMSSKDFINLLMKTLNMTLPGARTYASTAKARAATMTANAPAVSAPATPPQPAVVQQQPKQVKAPATQPAPTVPTTLTHEQTVGRWFKDKGLSAEFTIQPDGSVDVDGDIHKYNLQETRFPFKFGHVTGDFMISMSELTTLENGPSVVGADFFIDHAHLTSLVGSPQKVGAGMAYSGNVRVTSLEGMTSVCGGDVHLSHMHGLTSLQNIHKHLREMDGSLFLEDTPIESHVLGVLLIKGLKEVKNMANKQVQEILNKHLQGERNVHMCQEELIDAGFAKFARI